MMEKSEILNEEIQWLVCVVAFSVFCIEMKVKLKSNLEFAMESIEYHHLAIAPDIHKMIAS